MQVTTKTMSRARKNNPPISSAPLLFIVFALLIGAAVVNVNLFRNVTAALFPSSFLAESGAAGVTQAIVTVQLSAENYPSASFTPLSGTQYTASSLSCLDKAYTRSRSSISAYEASLAKKNSCVANQVKAWLLGQKAGAAESSITLLQTNIDSSQKMLASLKGADSFALNIYPGGENKTIIYNTVSSPAMLCLKDRSDPSAISPEVPIGAFTASMVNAFAPALPSQERELSETGKKAQALEEELKKAATKVDRAIIALKIRALIGSLSGRFLAVDLATAQKSHKSVVGRGFLVSVGASTNRAKECDPGGAVRRIAIIGSSVTGEDKWFTTTIGVNNLSVTDCVAYVGILRDASEGIGKYIEKLEKLKTGHIATLASLKKQIKTLRDNNYYCDSGAEK